MSGVRYTSSFPAFDCTSVPTKTSLPNCPENRPLLALGVCLEAKFKERSYVSCSERQKERRKYPRLPEVAFYLTRLAADVIASD